RHAGAQGGRCRRGAQRCRQAGHRDLRVSLSGARADGAARRGCELDASSCEIWCGDQFQTVDQANAAATAGLKPEQVKIHTLLAGGSFGRRANMGSDYIVEAVSVAKALGANGTPVKLQWTREDDIRGGLYRPLYLHRLEAALDNNGKLVDWQHRIVGQSIMAGTAFAAVMVKNGIDGTSVEGAANLPYAVRSN